MHHCGKLIASCSIISVAALFCGGLVLVHNHIVWPHPGIIWIEEQRQTLHGVGESGFERSEASSGIFISQPDKAREPTAAKNGIERGANTSLTTSGANSQPPIAPSLVAAEASQVTPNVSAPMTSAAKSTPPSYFRAIDYGVKADGTTDDTAALQAAITAAFAGVPAGGRAALIVPPGQIILSSTIVIDGNNQKSLSMLGYGQFATVFTRSTNYGDTFRIQRNSQGQFSNFGVISTNERTSGIDLNISTVYQGLFENIILQDWFVGIKVTNGVDVIFNNVRAKSGQWFTDATFKAGSKGFWLASGSGFAGSGSSNAIFMSNCAFGPTSGNNKIDVMMHVEAIDGLWTNNLTLGPGAYNVLLLIKPASGSLVGGMHFDRLWTDFYAQVGVQILADTGSDIIGVFMTNFTLEGSVSENLLAQGIGNTIVGLRLGDGQIIDSQRLGAVLTGVTGAGIHNVSFWGNRSTALSLGLGTKDSQIVGNYVAAGGATYGIDVQSGAVNNILGLNRVTGASSAKILDSGTTTTLARSASAR
jgi:hypothetical protein